jgi:hypothetical protein
MSKKISDLTSATTPLAGTEIIELVQSGTSKKVAVSYLVSSGGREVLSAARTYYVRTDGSNSNTGLANTSGGAFLTIQKAVDVVYQTLDLSIYNVTIQVADGTYSGTIVCSGPLIGSGTLTISGNVTTPTNVVISTGANTSIVSKLGAAVDLKDFKVTNTAGYGIQATQKGHINYQGIDFGTISASQVRADDGGTVTCTGNYTISGGATDHFNAVTCGIIRTFSKTITLSGTPAYTNFSTCGYCGVQIVHGNTFSGTGATGVRYVVSLNGVISTNGGGASYFPGNSAGTTATGGQYA